jgi:vanillin dehydrogenase
MAGSRIIVEAPVYEEFLKKFAAKAQTLQVGDPRDPHTVIGPLIRSSQCPMIDKKVKGAVGAGARLLCGGKYHGNFYHPTVVADVTPQMDAFRDELFGPVAAVSKANDADHARVLANISTYGLSSAVLTNNMQLAMKFALELEARHGPPKRSHCSRRSKCTFRRRQGFRHGPRRRPLVHQEMTEIKWITIQMGKRPYPF